jgi:predicted LPLAT superfamily acyltransferase
MKLNVEPNLGSPDEFYAQLVDIHRDLTDEQSQMLNAKLILLLANHIGDMEVLRAALAAARDGLA